MHGRRLAELDVTLALESGRPDLVLAAAERGRAVTNRLAPVRPPDDPAAARLLSELRQTVEALRVVEQDGRRAAPLLRRRRELEDRIAAAAWTRAGSGQVRSVVGLDELHGLLGDQALLSFTRADGRLHAVLVADGSATLYGCGPAAAVEEQVRRVRADLDVLALPLPGGGRRATADEPLWAAVRASLAGSLARLDDALLRPARLRGRLVVAGTGLLGQLPWGLLPSLRQVPVVVAPSATAWQAAHLAPPSGHRRTVAVAGPGLDRAVDEAREVGRQWDGAVLVGPDASGAAVRTALATSRMLHVAAHGVHNTENPLFSAFRLADGPLFAHELDRSSRTPDHVVLSACEAGLATIRPGRRGAGAHQRVAPAGHPHVVAGVGRVGDEAAAAAMADYHARLRAGADSAAALADALGAAPDLPLSCFGAAVGG